MLLKFQEKKRLVASNW